MSVRQVAEYLQLNEKKVYALAAQGKIPATKVTGKWLFPQVLVDEWLIETSHQGVLTDRLIVVGGDDPLLHRVVAQLTEGSRANALVVYSATGSGAGLRLLARRRADGCVVHWGPVEESDHRHPGLLSRFPESRQWVLVRLMLREQGIVLGRRFDPAQAELRADPFAADLRWVLRGAESGAQRFLAEAAARHDVDLDTLAVVARAGSSREALAMVAMGEADATPGPRSLASELGLGFLPVGWEALDVALGRNVYFRNLFQALIDTLRAPGIQEIATLLGGYRLTDAGRLVWSA